MKNLIVGAGLSGAVLAERIASHFNEEVLVIDKKNHIAGSYFDYIDPKTGILVQKYGFNVLHTDDSFVWDFLSNFTEWEYYYHKPQVMIQGNKTSLPINLNSLYDLFPESFAKSFEEKLIAKYGYNAKVSISELQKNFDDNLKFLANYIYENVFKPFTIKQLGLKESFIPSCSESSFPIFVNRDDRYYQEKYQAIPKHGWTCLIENLLKNKNIKVKLNTEYIDINPKKFDRIFFTGSIDEFFDYKHGELTYRSNSYKIVEENVENYQNATVLNFPKDYDFTRVIEYKNFLNTKSDSTILSFEYSEDFQLGKNERSYPIKTAHSKEIFEKYLEEANKLENVYFAGKFGDFNYYESENTVNRAIEVASNIFMFNSKNSDNTTDEVHLENE